MKWLAVIALAACQRSEPAPAVGSAGPAVLNTQVVGCAPAAERPRVIREQPTVPTGWFPYALAGETPAEIATPVAQKANLALVERLADLDLCLTDKTGSVSIMLEVDKAGAIKPRVGGIGHRPTELCIAKIASSLALPRPSQVTELECGLSAGAAGPLRVDVEGGYKLVELTADGVLLAGKPADLDKPLALTESVLVIAAPDTEADRLAKVLAWVAKAPAVLVAVRADGGPPVFIAMAEDGADTSRAGAHVVSDQLVACMGKQTAKAPLLEAKRVDEALGSVLATCGDACPEVVEVGVGGAHSAKQLIGATSAIRRAGRDPVLSLGARCQ